MRLLKKFKGFIFPLSFIVIIIAIIIVLSLIGNNSKADEYYNEVVYYSEENGLRVEFVLALLYAESNFNSQAVSAKGAIGLMQLMPETASYIAERIGYSEDIDLKNSSCNLRLGCAYIQYLSKSFNSDYLLLCAYNAGEGNVRKWLNDKRYSQDGVSINNVPFGQTKRYAEKVLKAQKYYKKYLIKKGYYEKEY